MNRAQCQDLKELEKVEAQKGKAKEDVQSMMQLQVMISPDSKCHSQRKRSINNQSINDQSDTCLSAQLAR